MGRGRGRRHKNRKNRNKGNFVDPGIEGFAAAIPRKKKKKQKQRLTLEDHVIGAAQDKAEVHRAKRKRVKKIRPAVPVVLKEDANATSCTKRLTPSL